MLAGPYYLYMYMYIHEKISFVEDGSNQEICAKVLGYTVHVCHCCQPIKTPISINIKGNQYKFYCFQYYIGTKY